MAQNPGEPTGTPIRPNSNLGELLRRDLGPGEYASVESVPHQGHVDRNLYRKTSSGGIEQLGHFRDPFPNR
jgi:hypothetical protein